ncbi:hypothetical protein CHS0354_023381 [Potamilus streckersoni]|uniref:Uncharacterized protein n=1 Tax=Potamilus streckersoni TaxID=2493646 RepID=A0AAE0W6C6_9BIVA|nr:hypothetical protein CHS0354_023381 [Potamilus streckersoni]
MAKEEAKLSKAMLTADESEDSPHQKGGLDLISISGLRFHEGIRQVKKEYSNILCTHLSVVIARSVFMIVEMIEDRINIALERSKMLQDLSCRWTKKFASIARLEDGEFEHGTLYTATTRLLLAPVAEAKIQMRFKNEVRDGPLEMLHQ